MDLFSVIEEKKRTQHAPLADRLRPETLDDIVGQEALLGPQAVLRRLILSDRVPSMILYGPPGAGKTTIAQVIAKTTAQDFVKISAVSAGIKDVRAVVDEAKRRWQTIGTGTILFIDEIHRFNKAQQDALLPHVENGTLTLVGATTENPFFEVNRALLSRCQLFELHALEETDLSSLIDRALCASHGLASYSIQLEPSARQLLCRVSGGDARALLNALEMSVFSSSKQADGTILVTRENVERATSQQAHYDKGDEEHYNSISAFIKSVRGSDADAAIYYLARMLQGGEDPLFIARRLVILASEDIGNADPRGLLLANACQESCARIGMPEARIILAQTTTYLALAPKSNASYLAIDRALEFVRSEKAQDVPAHLKDAHYAGAAQLGRGLDYQYPHSYPNHWVDQEYLPVSIRDQIFYEPTELGFETQLRQKKLDLQSKKGQKHAD